MLKFLAAYRDLGLLIGRTGLGILYVLHGWPKLAGGQSAWVHYGHAMSNIGISFLPQFWGLLAGLAELGGGVLLVLGLFFRPAAFFIGFTMFVAFMTEWRGNHGFDRYSVPLEMLLIFVILLFVGPGKYSFDRG